MKKILVIVDMQNDFIDGPLGTPEARAIVDNVCAKIREGEWDKVYYTMDTHNDNYLDTQEGRKLPIVHCVKNDPGWMLNADVMSTISNINEYTKIEKCTFGSINLAGMLNGYVLHAALEGGKMYTVEDIMNGAMHHGYDIELTLVGVCTDICVISNALLLKAHYPEMKIVVDASCCAGSTPEKHRMALEVMKSCQIDIVNDYGVDDYIMIADVSKKFERVNPVTPTEVRTMLLNTHAEEKMVDGE